jgi:hypothetical protein
VAIPGRIVPVERIAPHAGIKVHVVLNNHLRWIVEQGNAISRSPLHRYLVKHKDERVAAKLEQVNWVSAEEATRLRCLTLAAESYRGCELAELLSQLPQKSSAD